MDKFLTFQGLQPIWLGDFDFMQKAVQDVFANLAKALSGYDAAILAGVDFSYDSESQTISWSEGVVVLDGEVLPVQSGNLNLQMSSSKTVYFDISSSSYPEGERLFKDGQNHNCYEKREAVVTPSPTKWGNVFNFPRMILTEKKLSSFVSDVDGIDMSAQLVLKNNAYYIVGAFKTTDNVTSVIVNNVDLSIEQPYKSAILSGKTIQGKTYYALALSSAIELGTAIGETTNVVPLMVSVASTTTGIGLKMQIAPELPELGVILPPGIQSTFEIRLNTI